jgi:hypothetical protein
MSEKIKIDLMEIDKAAGKHWLSKLTDEELAERQDEIRRKNRERWLIEQGRLPPKSEP